MTFTQLEIFALIAELKSFTATAEKLGISQSAVSHALKSLEQQWGINLISRTQSDIELTTTGQQLLTHVKELLSISDTLEKEVAAIHGLNEGTLRIGSFGASSSIYLLPEILEAFRQCYPKIEIYIDEGEDKEVAQWLLERRIEVGFLIMPDERFDTFPLIEDRFVALIPSGYPLAQQLYIDPAQLENCPFIMTMVGSRHQVELILKNFNVKPDIKFYVSQILSIVSMVHNQLGISIVSDMVITKELLSLYPNVVKRPFKPNLKRSIGLAVKNKKHISPAVKAFIEVAQEVWSDH
ncbi:LysR family transcriptional regulator [Acinetobacter baumannii]|uniref:LysR family transcriptional regulator n=1 Tax=Acinetobacter baumannii TaxID=470 RepID=UPI0002AED165|nr:LysR family transcriptional regulator [Acinetobacter baumannii]EHU1283775.1 LysR family transcriptional regulator [Acinetobacter baumannii]EHU1368393.1 LysR family transcriptional regulator [Acinetobacter baumannii]EHU1388722.1 LysR family transcriptional regulator [Acinetobacter baumannii]EHU1401013.1 LysR family transcriptional regulator [Acinetobacter baumannii]EHU1680990.1 LysR family transcriptional regulator [Acinetobacter baumannii]